MKNKFSTVSLDQLINDCTGDTDITSTNNFDEDIDNALTQYNASDISQSVSPDLQNLVDPAGNNIDHNKIYSQLAKLIETGNDALANLSSFEIDPSNSESITATASLLNSIKNVVSEFTKIHQQHIKFQQAIELEQIKFRHKQELTKLRAELAAQTKKSNNDMSDIPSENTLIEVIDNDIINYIKHKKAQQYIQERPLTDDLV